MTEFEADGKRVLVAGATGSVAGLTRSPVKAEAIRRAGGEAAVGDALNRAAIVAAVAGGRPEVIVHEMTSLRAANDLRRVDRAFALPIGCGDAGCGMARGDERATLARRHEAQIGNSETIEG